MWAYNQIDVYLSGEENILGETSVNTNSWVPLSIYGLLHSRPVLTPSTVEGDSISIPGKNGKRLSIINNRTNAKLKFQIIAMDAWPFAELKAQGVTIRDRINYLKSYLEDAKRVSYKCPGRVPNSFFEIVKTTITNHNDADEKVQALEVEMELMPFEYYFDGNQVINVAANSSTTISNPLPFSTCEPVIIFSKLGHGDASPEQSTSGKIVMTKEDGTAYTIKYYNADIAYSPVTLEIGKELAYYRYVDYQTQKQVYLNANRYLSGDDYTNFKIEKGTTVTISNQFYAPMKIYTRKGLTV